MDTDKKNAKNDI